MKAARTPLMEARPPRPSFAVLALCALLALVSCQLEDPPEAQTLVKVRLNASMARYDLVVVELYARSDSNQVLATLWNDRLQSPSSQIPAYDVKGMGDEFIVKVTGYLPGKRLALQTRIFYSPVDGTIVVHDSVPPPVPQNWLESLRPSVGTLSPPFFKDSLLYLVKLPQDVDSIYFTPRAPNPFVIVQADGQDIPDGKPSKTYKIGSSPDTARFLVSDSSTGAWSTREYKVAMIPTPPLGLLLAKLVPSTGRLGTEFTPENTVYNLYMPPDVDTVSFLVSPLDPKTMSMTVDNEAVFADRQSQVITVARGAIYKVVIYVTKAGKKAYYQVTLDHTQTSSH
jgi:hypothetical protein